MNITCIIPVANEEMFINYLAPSINANERQPSQIILIDNVSGDEASKNEASKRVSLKQHIKSTTSTGDFSQGIITEIIRKEPPGIYSFNESLRLAFKLLPYDADIVCIMNDDIILNNQFFLNLINGFKNSSESKLAVLLPREIKPPAEPPIGSPFCASSLCRINYTKKKVGCCICIRKCVLDLIPEIPKPLEMFYGDSWIFYWVHRLGYLRGNMLHNPVYHFVGSSTKKDIRKYRNIRANEHSIYKKYVAMYPYADISLKEAIQLLNSIK